MVKEMNKNRGWIGIIDLNEILMKNPDFIIAGHQKCGTTALWKNLPQHPQLYMASREKDRIKKYSEIDFFS